MDLAATQALNDNKITIAETKYAMARCILDGILERKDDVIVFSNSLRTDVVDTMKRIQTKHQAERKLYDLAGNERINNYYTSSTELALQNKQWRSDIKTLEMTTNASVWNIDSVESFNIPPLTLGTWVKLHYKYDMDTIGYALPLYTLHGLDVLQSVLVDIVTRFEFDDGTELSFEVENVQNQSFYKLFGKKQLIIIWLDNCNLPLPWKCNSHLANELVDRCYMMVKNVKLNPITDQNDTLFASIVESLIRTPKLLYSPNMPYDLKPFPNIVTVYEESLQFTSPDNLWRQLSNMDYKYTIVAQQLPRTFSGDMNMSRLKLHFWLSVNKIPSNLLVRNVNNSMKRLIKSDKNSTKLVYVVPRKNIIHIFDIGLNDRIKFSLGPLMPSIVLASTGFESLFDCSIILQNIFYIGVFNSIVITNHTIRPMPQTMQGKQLDAIIGNVRTISHSQINSIMQNHFNQMQQVQPKVIVTVKGLQFVLFEYKDISFYTFVNSISSNAIMFNFYDIMLKLLLENKQKIFENDKNLGICISHFLDYMANK